MSKFQIILMSVFGFFIVLAVATFALYKGGTSGAESTVVVWGDISGDELGSLIDSTATNLDKELNIRYREMESATIDEEFTEALARGEGPDLLITTQDRLWKNKSKIIAIPYSSISERDFKDAFIEESELFLSPEGIYGLPLSVDPMVLYYNRDLLSALGLAKPIAYWDEIYSLALKLNKKDGAGNLIQSAIAMGETRNISNYKEILSLLMFQAGTPVTGYVGTELRSLLTESFDLPVSPSESALVFYTQFSNPTKAYYSWNRALPDAQTHFTSGDSVYYLGFASEFRALRNKNPNLNIGVAPMPQSRVRGRSITYGRLRAVAIARGSRNTSAALRAALLLVSKDMAKPLSERLFLPPVRRDLLSSRPSDAVMPVFYESALQSRGWLDPENNITRIIFEEMINTITSGRARTNEAINAASTKLEALIK